ncbi:MAG: ATP-dependent Lon protease [Eubacteriales bacterium]|nr:ATP-dependent Lon protease [Eubacteriales bacterium]
MDMASFGLVLTIVQFFFALVAGLYFWSLLQQQRGSRTAVERENWREREKLEQMRKISLTEPLAERTRPRRFDEIVGQEEGLRALRAALCGPNPQHVIIYGPPGVGKTAAARLVLEEAIKNPLSPFNEGARFVEVDATTARFDERGIADPIIGSVHDPIYQGAGPLGMAGIPQPKPGAVTRAHGGILFIDEIGEMHPVQLNKLLKVLEDRKVFLESAYYNEDDKNIPAYIHDIFQKGLPADFRLVGATTRSPEEIPPALRSRCVEIFFRGLRPAEVAEIARRAADRIGVELEPEALQVIVRYANNGRETVNILQIAAGVAITENRQRVTAADVEWVVNSGQYTPRLEKKVPAMPQVGYVNGLAVRGPNTGTLLEVEAVAIRVAPGRGRLILTGAVDEEEIGEKGRTVRRKSMVRGSVENVLTVLRKYTDVDPEEYDLHLNFPGGTPIDGPSAGIAIATAIYSAIKGLPVDNLLAMTGELSLTGRVKPVGGIVAKVEAACQAGARRVLVPAENRQSLLASKWGIEILGVHNLTEVFHYAFNCERTKGEAGREEKQEVLTAAPLG